MLHDSNYTLIKLIHDMSSMLWYVKKHAHEDVKSAGHEILPQVLGELEADLEKNITRLTQAVEGLSKEGKFK